MLKISWRLLTIITSISFLFTTTTCDCSENATFAAIEMLFFPSHVVMNVGNISEPVNVNGNLFRLIKVNVLFRD